MKQKWRNRWALAAGALILFSVAWFVIDLGRFVAYLFRAR